jgi:hypothetical protein
MELEMKIVVKSMEEAKSRYGAIEISTSRKTPFYDLS